jgi:transposase
VLDNYAAHKHPKVRAWLGRHPRFVFHFIPTSASWLNAVEGLFAKLSRQRRPHAFALRARGGIFWRAGRAASINFRVLSQLIKA